MQQENGLWDWIAKPLMVLFTVVVLVVLRTAWVVLWTIYDWWCQFLFGGE
jgi:uncharacterized membrane-anchored protein